MNKRRFAWIVALVLGLAAAAEAIRRQFQAAPEPPMLPSPEPPEPPRIVLPQSVLDEEQAEEQVADEQVADEQAPAEQPAEEQLLERAVGESAPQPVGQPIPDPETVEAAHETAEESDGDEMTGYCMHCRERRTIVNGEEVQTENGRRALSGTCEVCGGGIFRFLPNKEGQAQ